MSDLLDVMAVRATGDPAAAVLRDLAPRAVEEVACDVLVVGGGTGGVAAALALARAGRTVCLTEETDWIGGQLTAQGVSALDEHEHIEAFGGTRAYYGLRDAIRARYRALSPALAAERSFAFSPADLARMVDEFNGQAITASATLGAPDLVRTPATRPVGERSTESTASP